MKTILPLSVTAIVVLMVCGAWDASPVSVPSVRAGESQPAPDSNKDLDAKIKNLQAKIKELEGQLKEAKDLQAQLQDLEELKKLQGNWSVVRQLSSGQLQVGGFHPDWKFHGNTLTLTRGDKQSFTIDTTVRPRRLNLADRNAVGENITRWFIYAFDDDHLLLAESDLVAPTGPPTDFSGSITLFRLKRVKE
jgi:uncharacterized protein (TIGR03067 family)